jgi:cell division protein FtsI (penicillin-binding protein 3)
VSAPVFREVMTGALRLLDVPPDNVQQWYAGGPVVPAPAATAASTVASAVVPAKRQAAGATP